MLRSSTESERGVHERTLPAGVVTFVFTDIEGSTRLLRVLGDRYGELLAIHNAIIRDAVRAHGGTEIRTEGDAFFCAFSNPSNAIAACLDVQVALHAYPWPEGAQLRTRIGMHTGEADPVDDDYVALAVHQAARVSDAGHGGQVLVSDATRLFAGERLPADASLRPLGRFRLKGFPEPAPLHQLVHPQLPSDFPALRALPAGAHNVPEQATLFIGRQTALSELAQLVRTSRLVTILGAGGVGKTRLATEAVPLLSDQFPDGVWLIELGRLEHGEAVAADVAGELGVRAEAERSAAETLAAALATKRMLLVLDCCEHVLHATASLAERLIGRCPGVHILATSREPLVVPGEKRYPLAPLTLPDNARSVGVSESEAVALFVDRARIVAPGFDLARDQEAVVEICRRLDGLPLAIELAAARTAAISAARIAARLDHRFSVLRQGYRTALPHQETLRASIEWSHELLAEHERVLLRRLGSFTGQFDLEAAEAICASPPLTEDEVLDLLARLVEKSLVQQSDGRYHLLETIREFAREQIDAAGESEELADAHLAHYAAVVEVLAREADGPGQRAAYDSLDADLANIRAAVERAIARSDPAALRLCAALGQYGFVRNRLGEVARWCIDAAAAVPDAPAALRARAVTQAGFGLVVMGSPEAGRTLVDDGLALARASEDPKLLVEALLMAADLRLEAGIMDEARPLAAEALSLASDLGDYWILGRALVVSARADQHGLGYETTRARFAEALRYFERSGDRRQAARVLMTMAYLSLGTGDVDSAEAAAERCVELCKQLEHPIGRAMAQLVQLWVALDRDQPSTARALLEEALTTARDSGYRTLLQYCAAAQAAVAAGDGDRTEAARLLEDLGDAALGGEGAAVVGERVRRLREQLQAA